MILSEETKQKILNILDSKEFMSDLYEGLDEETRTRLGMFYTPGKICIKMIEKFSWDTLTGKTILDPTVGSGNLLIACLIAGADSDKIYGNEYDAVAVELCRKRINRACDILGKPHINDWQIHQGNALQARCLVEFGPSYSGDAEHEYHYQPKYIDDLEYAQTIDKDVEESYELLGQPFTNVVHKEAKSWRWENEHAKARAKAKAKAEAKAQAPQYEQVSLW